MHPRLLEYYNRELAHLRDMGAEFAQEFPKVAARLGMEGMEVADPYVERLLEGFAFVAARIQLKLDAEFPRFTQHLLEMVYPHFLAPTPSFGIVALQPNFAEGSLAQGVRSGRIEEVDGGVWIDLSREGNDAGNGVMIVGATLEDLVGALVV